MNKEEIEQAKEDLMFFNQGDWITREMEHSADVLQEYIKQLEKNKEEAYYKGYAARDKQAREICKTCNYRTKYRQLELNSNILDTECSRLEKKEEILHKVTDELKEVDKKYKNEYENIENMELSATKICVLQELSCVIEDIEEILKIIEGGKK